MARKRKPYRKVRDKHFLEISKMPRMENKNEALKWIKSSVAMEYIYQIIRNWKFIVAVEQGDGSYLWEGSKDGALEFTPTTSYGEKIFEALIKDEIHLMPPLRHKYPGEPYRMGDSEVMDFLSEKKNIMKLLFVTAAYNDLIIRNEDGSWEGEKYSEV